MRWLGCILASLMLPAAARADVAPVAGTQAVGPVFEKSDLVCSGTVRSIKIVGESTIGRPPKTVRRQHVLAAVEVEDSYKSTESVGSSVSVEFDREIPATRADMPAIERGEAALLFLSATGRSTYSFSDPFLGATRFEFLPPRLSGQGIQKLQDALAAHLQTASGSDRRSALELLGGFDTIAPSTSSALSPLLLSPDAEVAASAFAVMLKNKQSPDKNEILMLLKDRLASFPAEPEPAALINIGSALSETSDTHLLRAMESLSASRFAVIRRGAMQSLRAMKDRDAASTLVKRLDDQDGYVRYLAVISLSEAFDKHEDYGPSMYLFDKNPDFYVGLWKDWWTSTRR
jgi:hypothetical protein